MIIQSGFRIYTRRADLGAHDEYKTSTFKYPFRAHHRRSTLKQTPPSISIFNRLTFQVPTDNVCQVTTPKLIGQVGTKESSQQAGVFWTIG